MSDTKVGEMPKTMLILKSQATALGAVESYLKNRGWTVHATANLKEALVYIITQKPAFVAISIDHPNRKVRVLPKILSQALPCAIIVFAESSSSSSYKTLNDLQVEYRVYPPVTGPAFERCVNKYVKDQQVPETEESLNEVVKGDNNHDSGGGFSVKVKHQESKFKKQKAPPAFEEEKAKQLLSQFLNTEEGEVSVAGKNNPFDENLIFAQPIDEDDGKDTVGYIPRDKPVKKGKDHIIGGTPENDTDYEALQEGSKRKGHNYLQKGTAKKGGNYVDSNEDQGGDWGSAKNGKVTGEEHSATQSGGGPGIMNSATQKGPGAGVNGTAHDGEASREEQKRQQKKKGWSQIGSDSGIHVKSKKTVKDKGDTLIVRGTEKAIQEAIVVKDGPVKELLEDSTSAACIVVESDRFSGYLVAVMAGTRKIDQKFIDTIKLRLFKFLKDNGEDLSDNNAMDIKIKQVAFEPWAVEYADFLRKSVHEGNEVAMAFFPRPEAKAKVEESHDKNMAKIQLTDLEGDRQVEFDLYVYLPSNQKMVLYTPKGGVFYNKQLDKLKKQGVTHMHIPMTAAQDMSKYKAQNYLNDLVDDFEKKQEADTGKKKEEAGKKKAS